MTARGDGEPIDRHPVGPDGPSAGDDGDDAEPPGRSQPLTIDCVMEGGDWSCFEPVATAVATAAGGIAACPDVAAHLPACATVAFATDAAVRDLNRSFRGIDKPTNVLSFQAGPLAGGDGDSVAPFLGDIVLADATLLQEAEELGVPPRHHLVHLVVHGVLHLMGYDHETDSGAAVMEGLETSILAELGISDPYA